MSSNTDSSEETPTLEAAALELGEIPLKTLVDLATWAGRNTICNLGFIPDERLTWKPAPEALSALEIADHLAETLRGMLPVFTEGRWQASPVESTSRAEAEAHVRAAVEDYVAALRKVRAPDLERPVIAGRRQLHVPLGRAAAMAVIDLIHHHGQIVYIQTLLGDREAHFAPDA